MERTVTPTEALGGREWCIVSDLGVYDLYRNEDDARCISKSLNDRYGKERFQVAHIEDAGLSVVHCRDCRHCFDWAYDQPLCKLWSQNDPDDSEAGNGNATYPVVRPDGFCAWGEVAV